MTHSGGGYLPNMEFNFNPILLIWFPVFLFSLTLHEFAHALSAKWGGDMTATYKGRLTLNPIPHIDPVGTIALPLIAGLTGLPLFGWAKPVPVNELRLRHSRWTVFVSLAGPLSNILLVVVSAILLKVLFAAGVLQGVEGLDVGNWRGAVFTALTLFILTNILLALFNLMPIPPLDGSHVVHYYLVRRNPSMWRFWEFLQRFGMIVLWLLIFVSPLGRYLFAAIHATAGAILYWVNT